MFPFGFLLINDIDAPGVPLVFVILALLRFLNDGTGSQKDRQALRRRTVVRTDHWPDCDARPLTQGASMGLDNYCTRTAAIVF
jgi:hypothetical protein